MTDEATETEIPTYEIPASEVSNFVLYQQLQFQRDPTDGSVQIGVIQVPVPRGLIEEFQSQFGEAMADENMKMVIVKGKAFLAPNKTTSLIGFRDT